MDDFLRTLDFEFLGTGGHKISHQDFFHDPEAILLDVRTRQETDSVAFPLVYHASLSLQIPLEELPDRLEEIPRNRCIGILCVTDVRSAVAWAYLQTRGYTLARILPGGTAGLLDHLKTGKVFKRIRARNDNEEKSA